jgi:fumarate hydratase subunit beta
MNVKTLRLPLKTSDIKDMRSGDRVLINGKLLTARDSSHRRIIDCINSGGELPFNLTGETIYYTGPTPARQGQVTGSAGPTTSTRMDVYTPRMLQAGIKCMIGKGKRSAEVRSAILKHKAIYFAVVGGAGALIANTIKSAKLVAYADLGAEAVFELVVENMPAIVINDIYGKDLYEDGKLKYRKKSEVKIC